MDYLVEFYDDSGRCFHRFRALTIFDALEQTTKTILRWQGFGFRNASCYLRSELQWNLEVN